MVNSAITYDWSVDTDNTIQDLLPDRYTSTSGRPSPNFVVGRNLEAKAISHFKDNTWNWSYYTSRGVRCFLDFKILQGSNKSIDYNDVMDEAKLIIFSISWLSPDENLSATTTLFYLRFLKIISDFGGAELGLINALNSESFIKKVSKGISPHFITYLVSLYGKLNRIVHSVVDVKPPRKRLLDKLKKISYDHYTSHEQHPPVPSRIYLYLLAELNSIISEALDVKASLGKMITDLGENKLLGQTKSTQDKIFIKDGVPFGKRSYEPIWKVYVEKQGSNMVELINNYKISDRVSFTLYIRDLLDAINLSLLAYTGARKVEIFNLKEKCLVTKVINNKTVYLIEGETSKLNKGIVRRAVWVTSEDAAHACELAKVIAFGLYKFSGESGENKRLTPIGISRMIHQHREGRKGDIPTGAEGRLFNPNGIFGCKFRAMVVSEVDMKELALIDPFRDWPSHKKIKLGEPWPLTAHQFRRSLALYASKSGLVTLPALRRQLQHITDRMAAYYSNGNSSAINIIGGGNDFIDDYIDEQPLSQFASYVKNVLMSDERLFGGHGNWINKADGTQKQIILGDRQRLFEQFKNREKAYEVTLLGGCTSGLPCKEKAMKNIAACLDCTGSVIDPERLTRVINSQKALVNKLNPSSVEYRTEGADLKLMVQYQDRISGKGE
ncbi:hypothetical protein [Shewanella sp. Arc9-LZ]|uniref:hypothetical protein n=1 Tax=Shewanella sp. Arc9-LZ TaxID=2698686 RepID=UPI00137C00C6|nr:hypothetical protein [Shewanella sp. Arc9-LZ]QHS14680.1 hypothetical protein GUY17_17030 [Shewanella sp. Arc9-LZ]